MSTIMVLCVLIAVAGVLAFIARRLLRYLMFFQQDGYNHTRFLQWLKQHNAFDKRGTVIALVCLMLTLKSTPLLAILIAFLGVAALVIVGWVIEKDPRTTGKVRLNMTARATRIYFGALALAVVGIALTSIVLTDISAQIDSSMWKIWLLAAIWIQVTPLMLVVADLFWKPFEQNLQDRFRREAEDLLKQGAPLVIGITGSYGKTSTKAILGDLLNQCVGPTYWPRGSINTVMGITRDIREKLRTTHRFAIIEMGAHGVGSIKRLCDFTPPRAAIVTAVGVMHLERFGNVENIYRAKSELPQALPRDGILVCNGDDPGARRMAKEYPTQHLYLYGFDKSAGPLDCYAKDIQFTDSGSRYVIEWKGVQYSVTTPLLGRPAISNSLAAFTMACALGGEPAYVAAALSTIQPVTNRLSIEKTKTGTFLQDAFNSNPTGFRSALEVLQGMNAKRRILMTPGMIELGDRQVIENETIAEQAGRFLDLAIVVGATNKDALLRGFAKSGLASEKIYAVPTREEAFRRLSEIESPGDIILIENDLPDLYESNARF